MTVGNHLVDDMTWYFSFQRSTEPYVEREEFDQALARLKSAGYLCRNHEPAWNELVQELSGASPEFAEHWERHDVAGGTSRTKRYLHPEVGLVTLVSTSLTLSERPGVRLIANTPADDQARLALMRLSEIGPLPIDWVVPGTPVHEAR